MKTKFLTLLFILTALGSCSDTATNPAPTEDSNNYYPLTQGSNWNYTSIPEAGAEPVDWTMQNAGDSTMNGRRYVKQRSTRAGKTEMSYLRRSNDTLWGTSDFELERNFPEGIALIEREGVMWVVKHDYGQYTVTDTFTVAEKGISHTVSGKTYSDVLHLHNSGLYKSAGSNDSYYEDYYFAKGVGLIESISSGGSVTRLQSYTIK